MRNTIGLALVVAAVGIPGANAGTTPTWRHALAVRSTELNREYHLGRFAVPATAGTTAKPAWLTALEARGRALNQRYSLGQYAAPRHGVDVEEVGGNRCSARGDGGRPADRRRLRSPGVASRSPTRSEICLRAERRPPVAAEPSAAAAAGFSRRRRRTRRAGLRERRLRGGEPGERHAERRARRRSRARARGRTRSSAARRRARRRCRA